MLSCCFHWKANINIAAAVLNAVTNLRYSVKYCFKILCSQACYLPPKERLLRFYFSDLQAVAKYTRQMDCYLQYCEEYCKKILVMFSAPLVSKKSCGKMSLYPFCVFSPSTVYLYACISIRKKTPTPQKNKT